MRSHAVAVLILTCLTLHAGFAFSAQTVVYTFGSNDRGEIGDGTTFNRLSPTVVKNTDGTGYLLNITKLSTGYAHCLALSQDGSALAWGGNSNGQIGDGGVTNPATIAEHVLSLSTISTISAGYNSNLAVLIDHTVWGWGANSSSNAPIQIKNGDGSAFDHIIAVASGQSHSLAVKDDGTVWAWGSGNFGELGNAANQQSTTPVQVQVAAGQFLTNVIAVSAGASTSAALKNDGSVWCWGYNNNGEIGDGTNVPKNIATRTLATNGQDPLSGVIALAAGGTNNHNLAILQNGTVVAWGYNGYGQIGNGASPTNAYVPVLVPGLTGITKVCVSANHSIALRNDGRVFFFGNNSYGQFGNGVSGSNYSTPVMNSSITSAIDIGAGAIFSAVLVDASAFQPSIQSITPNHGLIVGGDTITISGSNFSARCSP